MKKIVNPSYFVFEPANNRIDFTTFPSFNLTYLYAIINVTSGQLIYSTAGQSAGLQGSYSAPYLNLTFDVTSMGGADELQIIYNMSAQPIADADENAIFSTIDIDSGERGLNFNLLNSSFGGRINEPMSSPHEDKARALGINSGGFLRSPAIDPVTNQLIVDISQSGTIPTSIVNNPQVLSYPYNPSTSSPISFGAGASDINTQRVTANINQISDLFITGTAQSASQNNIITGTTAGTDCLGYRSFSAQLSMTATGGTIFFEGCNDNVSFQAIPVFAQNALNGTPFTTAISASVSNFIYTGSLPFRYLRIRIASSLTGGTVTAHVKLSPIAFVPTVMSVAQNTAANLNCTVAGSLTSVGTITSVSSVGSVGLAAGTVTDIASAAINTTVTSANIATTNLQASSFLINVTAITGSSTPSVDVVIQETLNGVDYVDIYHFPRITTTGVYQSPNIRHTGIGLRYVRTVLGTTPSITMSAIRISRQISCSLVRLFINRTIDPNALGSSTPAFNTDGCNMLNLCVSMGAGGSGVPAFKLQGSEDQVLWFDLGTTTVSVAPSSAGVAIYNGYLAKFVRAQVTATGSGVTLSQVCIKGNGE